MLEPITTTATFRPNGIRSRGGETYLLKTMDLISIMGYLAGTCTTLAVIPQISKAATSGEADNVSLKMYLVLLTGLGLWFFYGKGISNLPIMIFNGVAFLLNSFMVYFILKHRRKKKS